MEEKGKLINPKTKKLDDLCEALIGSGISLIKGIGLSRITKSHLDELTLLTVGPQLRGGANVKKGARGIVSVFEAISKIVEQATVSIDSSKIKILNAAGRNVVIEFAADPDIVIREELAPGKFRDHIAIEVKAGSDFSNIHNRVGEAEKSHLKAKNAGFVECWTVVNVDRIDIDIAKKESPSTNRFYRLSQIILGKGEEFEDFRNHIVLLTGIKIS